MKTKSTWPIIEKLAKRVLELNRQYNELDAVGDRLEEEIAAQLGRPQTTPKPKDMPDEIWEHLDGVQPDGWREALDLPTFGNQADLTKWEAECMATLRKAYEAQQRRKAGLPVEQETNNAPWSYIKDAEGRVTGVNLLFDFHGIPHMT